jgi:hypothetical protein
MSTKPKRLRFEWKRKAGDRSGAGFVERKSCTEAVQIEMEIDRAQRLNRELNPYSERVPRLGGVRGGSCAAGTRNSAEQEAAALELHQAQKCPSLQLPEKNDVANGRRNNRKPTSVPRRQIIPYHPNLKLRARELRNNSTHSEIQLWLQLKGKFMGKYDFHRQKPMLDFIADFYCYELRLVIEVEGGIHKNPLVRENDKRKELRLNAVGVNVVRFTNAQVLNEMPLVIECLGIYIQAYENRQVSSLASGIIPLNIFSKK